MSSTPSSSSSRRRPPPPRSLSPPRVRTQHDIESVLAELPQSQPGDDDGDTVVMAVDSDNEITEKTKDSTIPYLDRSQWDKETSSESYWQAALDIDSTMRMSAADDDADVCITEGEFHDVTVLKKRLKRDQQYAYWTLSELLKVKQSDRTWGTVEGGTYLCMVWEKVVERLQKDKDDERASVAWSKAVFWAADPVTRRLLQEKWDKHRQRGFDRRMDTYERLVRASRAIKEHQMTTLLVEKRELQRVMEEMENRFNCEICKLVPPCTDEHFFFVFVNCFHVVCNTCRD